MLVTLGAAADQLFPQGGNITCEYSLELTEFSTGDTLTINRVLRNNESFALSGLYFSDNLPPSFNVASYNLLLNGGNIEHYYSGASQDSVIGFYDTYYWVIDEPDVNKIVSNTINPGDVLELEIRITFTQAGYYSLPMHTTVFYGNQTGFFATDSGYLISVEGSDICGDVDGNGSINILDGTFLVSYLYKDGPAPAPIERGDVNGSGSVNLLDITHLISYLYKNGPDPICL